ncbi:MAG TPA: hypothetical protein VE136_18470 [Anaerolineales bacterium]|nr:hypothetical protein [Anaerolineales bacterium]
MDQSRLIWGIICLALAGLLTVLNLALSPDKLMFMVGDVNMPWIPPVVLAIVGIVLLAGAGGGARAEAEESQSEPVQDPEKAVLNRRMETIAWGCFLILLGGFMFVPNAMVNRGLWSIGLGVIMLGLNAARYFNNLRMSGFTTFLGILSLLGGIAEFLGVTSLEGALFFIILGAYLILKPWFEKRQLFGKAEQA